MTSTSAVLTDLIAQRNRLNRAIDALQALTPAATKPVVLASKKVVSPKRAKRRNRAAVSWPRAILGFLGANPGPQNLNAITDGLPAFGINGPRETRYAIVCSTLARLGTSGVVQRVGKSWQIPAPRVDVSINDGEIAFTEASA